MTGSLCIEGKDPFLITEVESYLIAHVLGGTRADNLF